MSQVYPERLTIAKRPAQAFAAELDQVIRRKVGELIQAALEAEVDEALQRLRYERSSTAIGYRDGHDPERSIVTGTGSVAFRRPRVRGAEFKSQLIPPYRRRLPTIDKTLNQLWIEGLAHRDFEPTLRGLLGQEAPLSPSTIARVNAEFQAEFAAWKARRIDDQRFVYLWADGVHLGAGPDDERRVLLVVIGADADGIKHLVALDEAMSESELSWTEIFSDLVRRGLRPPLLLVGDGAHGLWNAATGIFPDAAQQRCWLHKQRNVLDKVPQKHQPMVHVALREIMHAETEALARTRCEALAQQLQRDYPNAASCLRDDLDRMMSYYRFPQASWKSLRTTNVIESVFAPVRLRTNAAKRFRTGRSVTYLVYALITRLAKSWRRIDGHRTIADVLAQRTAA